MGTRNAYGFRVKGQDKISYCQFDGYPEGVGAQVLKFLAKTKPAEVKKIAEKIILVDPKSKPTPEQIKACASTTNLQVSEQSTSDWYCLLREAQGNLGAHKKVPYMRDAHDFLGDSLFCEWAYIVNLDTGKLEIYKGFNHNPKAKGRYAALDGGGDNQGSSGKKYYGVVLILTIPLKSIYKADQRKRDKFVAQMEKAAEEDEKKTIRLRSAPARKRRDRLNKTNPSV